MHNFFLGIDGGGTKTRCAIADETGKVISQGFAGGCKHSKYTTLDIAERNIASSVADAIGEAKIAYEDITRSCFGIPGFNDLNALQQVQRLVTATGLKSHVRIETDAKIAWAGALLCQPGIVVVSGNGFNVYGVTEDSKDMTGLEANGPGLIFGESCESLKNRILYECLVANQTSLLLLRVLDHIDLPTQEALMAKVRKKISFIEKDTADLLSVAASAAEQGDASAVNLFQAAGKTLGLAAVIIMKNLQVEKPITSFVGGAFEVCGSLLTQPFAATISSRFPNATIVHPCLKPVGGALLLAMQNADKKIDKTLTDNLAGSLAIKAKDRCF